MLLSTKKVRWCGAVDANGNVWVTDIVTDNVNGVGHLTVTKRIAVSLMNPLAPRFWHARIALPAPRLIDRLAASRTSSRTICWPLVAEVTAGGPSNVSTP